MPKSKLWLAATTLSHGEFEVIVYNTISATTLNGALKRWRKYYKDFYEDSLVDVMDEYTIEYVDVPASAHLETLEETTEFEIVERLKI